MFTQHTAGPGSRLNSEIPRTSATIQLPLASANLPVYVTAVYKLTLSLLLTAWLALPANGQVFSDASDTFTNPTSDSRSVNFIDLNNDGWDDLYISNGLQGGQRDLLYLNDGTGTLVQVTDMAIVQASSPADGASFADFNNDGHLDAMVSSWYGVADLLYLNDGAGALNFKGSAGIVSGSFAETAAFGDYDNDGWLDLYVTSSGTEGNNFLYRNLKNETFLRVNNHPLVNDNEPSRGAIWGDFNNDGLTDLFVANEGNNPNDLFWGTGGGGFEKLTEGLIVTDSRGSITASWGDIDNDGDLDLFVGNSNFFRPLPDQLFRNMGNGTFEAITDDPVTTASTCSFGSAFADYDNDGDLDLAVSNGFCNAGLPNALFQNQGDGTFVDVSSEFETNEAICSFGVAWGDVNNDGAMDLAFANCKNSATSDELPNSLLMNAGNANAWLKLKLTGVSTNRDAVGARIRARAVIDGVPTWQLRDIQAQTGYAGQNSSTVHFGLGDAAKVDTLIISWPAGNRQIFTDVTPNQLVEVTEVINVGTTGESVLPPSISFDLYPNPGSDTATARLRLVNNLGNASTMQLLVYNVAGQRVLQRSVLVPAGTSVMPLFKEAADLAAGVYHVVLASDQRRISRQLVHR